MTDKEVVNEFSKLFFKSWNEHRRKWLGIHLVKYPTDMLLYHMIMVDRKPDVLIETGSYLGGGALFFASMFDLIGKGLVISVDLRNLDRRPVHPRIQYIIGRCTAVDTLATIKGLVGDKTCMVVLDSDHHAHHVKRELRYYSKLVTPNQYLVVEDTMLGTVIDWKYGPNQSPLRAVEWFLNRDKDFVDDKLENWYLVSMAPGGWLRRVK